MRSSDGSDREGECYGGDRARTLDEDLEIESDSEFSYYSDEESLVKIAKKQKEKRKSLGKSKMVIDLNSAVPAEDQLSQAGVVSTGLTRLKKFHYNPENSYLG